MPLTVKDGRVVDAAACRVANCARPAVSRGLCGKHYQRAVAPRRPGHAEATAAILPARPAGPPPAVDEAPEITARDRETIEAVELVCEMTAGIPPADFERLMHLTYLLGGKQAFEQACGLKLRELHAAWRFQLDLAGLAEPEEEDDD